MRLIHTEPLRNVVARHEIAAKQVYEAAQAHTYLMKAGGDAITTHALSGELYASNSGWLLLDVPNALVRGAFDALNESGVELPPQSSGKLNAHISVMTPDEIESIGGINKITERGHHFHYTLGPIQEVVPRGWQEMSKVWFILVKSKELQDLRKSYGLSPRPRNGDHDFHISFAVRRKKVLQHNDVAKAAAVVRAAAEKRAFGPMSAVSALSNALYLNTVLGKKKSEPDLAELVNQDDSYIDAVRQLPVDIVPKKRKRNPLLTTLLQKPLVNLPLEAKNSSGVPPLFKQSEDSHALLEKNPAPADSPTETRRAGHDGTGEEIEREGGLLQPKQTEDWDCAPAALKTICDYYGTSAGEATDRFADDMNTTPEGGTAPNDIVQEAKGQKLKVDAKTPMSIDELKQHVEAGHPVIVAYQDHGEPSSYPANRSGHYSIVVGCDDAGVSLRDPANGGTNKTLPIDEFDKRWHDEDKHGKTYDRLGIAIWSEEAPRVDYGDGHEKESQQWLRVIFPNTDGRDLLRRAVPDLA